MVGVRGFGWKRDGFEWGWMAGGWGCRWMIDGCDRRVGGGCGGVD